MLRDKYVRSQIYEKMRKLKFTIKYHLSTCAILVFIQSGVGSICLTSTLAEAECQLVVFSKRVLAVEYDVKNESDAF